MSLKEIENFIKSRPDALGVFGYGSTSFKQEGYKNNAKPEIDLIFVVDDIVKWSREHIKECDGLSIATRSFMKNANDDKIFGKYGIYFLISIPFEESKYKMMVVDKNAFIESSLSFNHYLVAGRTQKLIHTYKSNEELDNIIQQNRIDAVKMALLVNENNKSLFDFIISICGFSYTGDIRMTYGENPKKVENIVNGSYELYKDMYIPKISQYASIDDDRIEYLKDYKYLIDSLPKCLKEHIADTKNSDEIRYLIYEYLMAINKETSRYLIGRGFQVNGYSRTISYGFKKVLKKYERFIK